MLYSCSRISLHVFLFVCLCGSVASAQFVESDASDVRSDEYDAPAGYYDSATGQGAQLKTQLTQIISSGHSQQTYGDIRYNASRYDADPNSPGKILLMYNRASVSSSWDSGNTWNREHVWPQSRQPGSASNGTRGNLGDPHALRPCNPTINSTRGNMPFGNYDSTGNYGSLGSYYFPGDQDKGDTARCLFYSSTRYNLTLVNGYPSGYEMGDLAALLRWHYTDVPDTFERRRNHIIFEDQHNRSPFVDRPEFVWSVFGDGANDSKLFVTDTAPSDGSSSLVLDLQDIIVGGTLPSSASFVLKKEGNDPTYYSVTTEGNVTPSVSGRMNAFDYSSGQQTISVGVNVPLALPGDYSGSLIIDNLDVSNQGAGTGSLDGDDVVDVSFTILDHSEASFDSEIDLDYLELYLGVIPSGSGVQEQDVSIFNLPSPSGFTADLEIVSVETLGDDDVISPGIESSTPATSGSETSITVTLDPSGAEQGMYSTVCVINVADEALPGSQAGIPLTLVLTVDISESIFPFDVDGDGDVESDDADHFLSCLGGPIAGYLEPVCAIHDSDEDGDVDLQDASVLMFMFE